MNKITKSALKLITGSLIVWFAVIMMFSDKIVFTNSDDSANDQDTAVPDDAELNDGVFTGSAKGHNGELVVEVTIEDKKIVSVVVTQHVESDGISDPAIEQVPAEIVANNSTDVDTVSGATVSSRAIINATNAALQASIDSGE